MTENELGDYGRMLAENLRAAGVSDIVTALMMAGYAVGCAVALKEEAPLMEDVLPIALKLLKTPPTFVDPPPVKN